MSDYSGDVASQYEMVSEDESDDAVGDQYDMVSDEDNLETVSDEENFESDKDSVSSTPISNLKSDDESHSNSISNDKTSIQSEQHSNSSCSHEDTLSHRSNKRPRSEYEDDESRPPEAKRMFGGCENNDGGDDDENSDDSESNFSPPPLLDVAVSDSQSLDSYCLNPPVLNLAHEELNTPTLDIGDENSGSPFISIANIRNTPPLDLDQYSNISSPESFRLSNVDNVSSEDIDDFKGSNSNGDGSVEGQSDLNTDKQKRDSEGELENPQSNRDLHSPESSPIHDLQVKDSVGFLSESSISSSSLGENVEEIITEDVNTNIPSAAEEECASILDLMGTETIKSKTMLEPSQNSDFKDVEEYSKQKPVSAKEKQFYDYDDHNVENDQAKDKTTADKKLLGGKTEEKTSLNMDVVGEISPNIEVVGETSPNMEVVDTSLDMEVVDASSLDMEVVDASSLDIEDDTDNENNTDDYMSSEDDCSDNEDVEKENESDTDEEKDTIDINATGDDCNKESDNINTSINSSPDIETEDDEVEDNEDEDTSNSLKNDKQLNGNEDDNAVGTDDDKNDTPLGIVIGAVQGVTQEEFDGIVIDSVHGVSQDDFDNQVDQSANTAEEMDIDALFHGKYALTQEEDSNSTESTETATASEIHDDIGPVSFEDITIKLEPEDDDDYIQEIEHQDSLEINRSQSSKTHMDPIPVQDMYEIAPDSGGIRCTRCKVKFLDIKLLKCHYERCHQKLYSCKKCGRPFQTSQALAGHSSGCGKLPAAKKISAINKRFNKKGKKSTYSPKIYKTHVDSLVSKEQQESQSIPKDEKIEPKSEINENVDKIFGCWMCHKPFYSYDALYEHMFICNKERGFPESINAIRNKMYNYFRRKVKNKPTVQRHKAIKDRRYTTNEHKKVKKVRHTASEHKKDQKVQVKSTYQCLYCPRRFQKQQMMASHTRLCKVDSQGNLKVPIRFAAKKIFAVKSPNKFIPLPVTIKQEIKDYRYKCTSCPFKCETLKFLRKHLRLKHPKCACRYCPKTFYKQKKSLQHLFQHIGEFSVVDTDVEGNDSKKRVYFCSICKAIVDTGAVGRKHVSYHMEQKFDEGAETPKFHECSYCGIPFMMKTSVLEHQQTHIQFLAKKQLSKLARKREQEYKIFQKTRMEQRNILTMLSKDVQFPPYIGMSVEAGSSQTDIQNKSPAPEQQSVSTTQRKTSTEKEATGNNQTTDDEDDNETLSNIPYKCGICKSRFPKTEYLMDHMKLHIKGEGKDTTIDALKENPAKEIDITGAYWSFLDYQRREMRTYNSYIKTPHKRPCHEIPHDDHSYVFHYVSDLEKAMMGHFTDFISKACQGRHLVPKKAEIILRFPSDGGSGVNSPLQTSALPIPAAQTQSMDSANKNIKAFEQAFKTKGATTKLQPMKPHVEAQSEPHPSPQATTTCSSPLSIPASASNAISATSRPIPLEEQKAKIVLSSNNLSHYQVRSVQFPAKHSNMLVSMIGAATDKVQSAPTSQPQSGVKIYDTTPNDKTEYVSLLKQSNSTNLKSLLIPKENSSSSFVANGGSAQSLSRTSSPTDTASPSSSLGSLDSSNTKARNIRTTDPQELEKLIQEQVKRNKEKEQIEKRKKDKEHYEFVKKEQSKQKLLEKDLQNKQIFYADLVNVVKPTEKQKELIIEHTVHKNINKGNYTTIVQKPVDPTVVKPTEKQTELILEHTLHKSIKKGNYTTIVQKHVDTKSESDIEYDDESSSDSDVYSSASDFEDNITYRNKDTAQPGNDVANTCTQVIEDKIRLALSSNGKSEHSYTLKQDIKQDIKPSLDTISYECKTCHKTYTSKKKLANHEHGHALKGIKKVKNETCTVCGKKVVSKWHLGKHMEKHKTLRP